MCQELWPALKAFPQLGQYDFESYVLPCMSLCKKADERLCEENKLFYWLYYINI